MLEIQIEPTFARHSYLCRALVLAIPGPWRLAAGGGPAFPISLMIFYSQDERLRLSAVVSSYTHGTQDPNLPDGVGNHDLFEEVGVIGSAGG